MSALEPPAEVLLVALFDAAEGAQAATRALLHNGLDASRIAALARDAQGMALGAVPRAAAFRLPGVGRVVALGMLAEALAAAPVGGLGRLGAALRRVGLSTNDAPRLEAAVRRGRIVLLAAVPLREAPGWGHLLQRAGAVSLGARPALGVWPPEPRSVSGRPARSGDRAMRAVG